MRFTIAAFALFAAVPASADAPPVPVDVPQDHGQQQVMVLIREFPVGGSSGWHTHPGFEIGQVLAGETEMRTPEGPPRRYKAGETFVIPRGFVHNGVNVGQLPARLAITYVTDKGAPLRTDAAEPHSHR